MNTKAIVEIVVTQFKTTSLNYQNILALSFVVAGLVNKKSVALSKDERISLVVSVKVTTLPCTSKKTAHTTPTAGSALHTTAPQSMKR